MIHSPVGRLSDEQLVDWLRLIRSDNVGPRTFRQLINRFGGAAAALDGLPSLLASSPGGRAIKIASRDDVLREIDASVKRGLRFIAMGSSEYPRLLGLVPSSPPILAVLGDVSALNRSCVAIVGSRNASASGRLIAARFARDLSRADQVVVSGLARGIDEAAHEASLDGGTIGVLAGGHARPYPSEHTPLIEKIAAKGGAVVSEMPLEWEPRGRDFPRRNRIVSGLCHAIVVVEAARRSGSLITARFALEQNREVFAVPGSPLDPRAEGPNQLLREGAHFCEKAEDILLGLAALTGTPSHENDLFADDGSPPLERDEELIDELDLDSFYPGLSENSSPALDTLGGDPFGEAILADRESFAAEKGAGFVSEPPPADLRETILALLGPTPIEVDHLIRICRRPAREIYGILLELDMEGRLERHGSSLISLL